MLFAFAGILHAQTYPMPWKSGGTPQKCTGCPGINLHSQPNDGLPTYPFSAPISRHVGRVVDSTITQDYQNVGMRTARARKVVIAEDRRGSAPARVYQQLGSTLAVYSLDKYLTTTLPKPMEQVSVFKTGWPFTAHQPQEMVHTPDAFVYAEGKNSGWITETVDGQDRLYDFDFDDRGNVYLAYTIFGWGIVKDDGDTSGGMLPKTYQEKNVILVPESSSSAAIIMGPTTIGVLKVGAKYYMVVSDRLAGTDRFAGVIIYDVTNPADPIRGRTATGKVNRVDKIVKDDSNSRVLVLNGDGNIRIYDSATYVNGGAPISTLTPPTGKVWTDVAAGGPGIFWATEAKSNFAATSSSIAKITEAGSSYAVDYISAYGAPFAAQYLGVHDRYLAVLGSDGAALDARIFKITSVGLELIDTAGYFQKYYHNSPSGYAMPAQNVNAGGIQPLKYDGKLFLMYNVRGLGDVYEIQAGDSVSASHSTNSYGTRNPNSKTNDGPYYGDILKFSSTTTNAFGFPVTWDFGNPEAGSDNTTAARTGDTVQHQWAGLSSATAITAPKTVKVWVGADDSISDALSVTMLKPVARVGIQDTNVTVASGTTGLAVVAGENFTDGSDGVIQGHVATWSIDGGLVNRTPDAVQPVGSVGPHTLKFTATYGPYSPDFVPTVLPAYQTAVDNVSYTVLPFMASISAPVKNTSGVTFTGVGRLAKQAGIVTSPTWTVTWSIKNASGVDIVPPQVTGENLGTITPFVVAPTITNGSVVKLKVEVPVSGLDPSAQQYPSYEATMNLTTPDAKVTMTGCTNAGLPCSFAVSSLSGASTDDWTYQWTVTGPSGFTTGSKTANPLTINIPISGDGVYNVSVKVTKGIFDTTVAHPAVNVQPTACGPLPAAGDMSIVQSCDRGCDVNVAISLRASFWSYASQECDTFTWVVDGQTKTGKSVTWTPTRTGTFTVKVTLSNTSGSAPITAQSTIVVGSTSEPPPPAECKAASTVSIITGCLSGQCKATDSVKFTANKNGESLQLCDTPVWEIAGATYTQRSPSVKLPAGTHTIKLTVTPSGKGSKSTTMSLVVVPAGSSSCAPPPGPQKFYVEYSGLTSGCTDLADSAPCTPGETIRLKATPYFYDWQSCDRWEWDFGDGSTKGSTVQVDHVFPQTNTQWEVALRVYNESDTTGTVIRKTVKMQAVVDTKPVPVLAFQGFPSTGSKGVPITFTVNSNIATTTGWTWTFSDVNGTDTTQASKTSSSNSITHTFAKLGTFTVKVQARNAESASQVLSASTQSPITISDTPEFRYLLPVVAHAGGLSDSSWRTDVQFYTPDTSVSPANPLSMTATFQGVNYPILIGKSTYIWEDFMAALKPGQDAQGPVIITLKSKYAPQIWTRTYNQTSAGTFGQFIPAVRLDEVGSGSAMGEGDYHLAGLRSDGVHYRTNVGLVNPNAQAVTATLRVYDHQGIPYPIENSTRTLQPFELQQFPAPGPADRPFSIEVQVPDGLWLIAYASFIDNHSNDPVFMRAIRASELGSPDYRSIMVPGVGHVGNWRSDVTIFNPDGHGMPVELTYHDPSGAAVGTASVNVPAGGFLQYADLLKQGVFGSIPDSVGMLRVTVPTGIPADLHPMAFARTYNDDGSGKTYGQGIAGFAGTRANVRPGSPAMIPGIRSNAKYYTNVGLTNVSSTTATVLVKVLNPFDGSELSVRPFELAPNASVVATNYCLGIPGEGGVCNNAVEDASIKIEVTGGSVWAFGSIIDKGTFDPEYVPATPLP